MKLFNLVYIAIVAAVAIAASLFLIQSHKADTYMQAEMRHNFYATAPTLRPLYRYKGYHWQLTDTPENRAKHGYGWVIDPGDGYLYSAWWL